MKTPKAYSLITATGGVTKWNPRKTQEKVTLLCAPWLARACGHKIRATVLFKKSWKTSKSLRLFIPEKHFSACICSTLCTGHNLTSLTLKQELPGHLGSLPNETRTERCRLIGARFSKVSTSEAIEFAAGKIPVKYPKVSIPGIYHHLTDACSITTRKVRTRWQLIGLFCVYISRFRVVSSVCGLTQLFFICWLLGWKSFYANLEGISFASLCNMFASCLSRPSTTITLPFKKQTLYWSSEEILLVIMRSLSEEIPFGAFSW